MTDSTDYQGTIHQSSYTEIEVINKVVAKGPFEDKAETINSDKELICDMKRMTNCYTYNLSII